MRFGDERLLESVGLSPIATVISNLQTWVMGIEYVSGKPYIYALIQYFWEP